MSSELSPIRQASQNYGYDTNLGYFAYLIIISYSPYFGKQYSSKYLFGKKTICLQNFIVMVSVIGFWVYKQVNQQ